MNAAEIPFGGGVSPRFTRRPKGQSIIEYVLIIAVIGLVVVFAGPGVAGAIRNQFNLVGNTVNSGTNGGVQGSGSAGADSATVQAAVGVRGIAEHRLLDDCTDASLVAGRRRRGEDASGISLGHGMADDGTEALTDILFGEAVVSLGHISPFVLGPKDSDLRELWETSLCRIRPMG